MKVYAILEECDDNYYEPHLAQPFIYFTRRKAEKAREAMAKDEFNLMYTWVEELEIKWHAKIFWRNFTTTAI